MITCLLIIMMAIGAWFMLQNARENVRAEIASTTSLTLHLLDREIFSLSAKLVGVPDSTPFDLATLSHIRHLRIEFFDVAGRLLESNQAGLHHTQSQMSPKWFINLMTTDSLQKTHRDVFFAGRLIGQLIITPDPMYEIVETWDDTKDILALIFIFFIAVTTVVYIAIESALKPVSRILTAINDVEQGKLETRLPHFDLPELSSIALKFNHMAETLEQSIKRNIGLSRQIINLEEVERKSLARDLHDEIGQSITAIHIDAQAILNYKEINEVTIQNLRLSANAILNVSKNMMGITHQILEKLRPDTIDKLGLKVAIQDLVGSWTCKLIGVHCALDIAGDLAGLPEDISITAYRVIQESLTNIARYANAKQVGINIIQEPNMLIVIIEDDGKGFESSQMTTGFGLTGMRERLEGLGGELELDSAIGSGTRLVARLPLNL